jgi:hypothetical protein
MAIYTDVLVPNGASSISLDGKNTIAVGFSINKTPTLVSGYVNIMAWFGPFRGIALTNVANVSSFSSGDTTVCIVDSGKFSYTDLTNWVPGYSSGIKYYWATARYVVIKTGDQFSVGFTIFNANTGEATVNVGPLPAKGNLQLS